MRVIVGVGVVAGPSPAMGAHLTSASGPASAGAPACPPAPAPGTMHRAEPGTGQLDLLACVDAFRRGFVGDYMIEVDIPTVPLKECHQIAYDWAVANLEFGQ